MLDWLIALDRAWFLRVNGYHGHWGDILMEVLSVKYSPLVYLPFLYLLYKKTNWKYIGCLLLGIGLTFAASDRIAAGLIKPLVLRLRPCHEPSLQNLVHLIDGCGGQYGFVSNHAANHFGLAVFFGLAFQQFYPKTMKWFLLFALAVSYSRVYMGVHYPGDVLCGGLLGVVLAYITWKVFKWFTSGKSFDVAPKR